jgi:hypothetical protein
MAFNLKGIKWYYVKRRGYVKARAPDAGPVAHRTSSCREQGPAIDTARLHWQLTYSSRECAFILLTSGPPRLCTGAMLTLNCFSTVLRMLYTYRPFFLITI